MGAVDVSKVDLSDEMIRAALDDAHIPSLMAALVHLTGSRDHIKPEWKPTYDFFGDGQGGLPAAAVAEIKARAFDAIKAHLAGAAMPAQPTVDNLRPLMDFVAGAEIPERYVPFLLEELGVVDMAARGAPATLDAPVQAKAQFQTLIIGAGMSGLLTAIHLQRAGLPFIIIDKNADVGGTWFENTYPGCRVDNPNHLYSYSFEPNHDWPMHYSTQDILYQYFRRVADKYNLRPHIRFNCELETAVFNEQTNLWQARIKAPDGQIETLTANAVISAVGQLNRPRLPDIEGRDSFAGPSFHSARWRHDVDLTGKRVAVIGTGASAFQFVPEIAPKVSHLTVFQRTPPWLGPTPNYHDKVSAGKQWLLRHVPFYEKWYRFWLFWMLTDGIYDYVKVDPNWQGPTTAVSETNMMLRTILEGLIVAQAKSKPDLAQKLVPQYPMGGKRSVRDNGVWVSALCRDNVDLTDSPIKRIVATGIETADGVLHEVDVIIFGTGFTASDFLMPMTFTGRDGVDLHQQWNGDARAYLGMTAPNFPNLFLLYGPNTNIVVNGSIIFFSECSVRYIMGCLKLLFDGQHKAIECRKDVHDTFNDEVDAGNKLMAWGVDQVTSWYKNANGRVSQNWPFPLVDYWTRTKAPDPSDFIFRD
jgi:4-hydroxyacetophenone monooxygenase